MEAFAVPAGGTGPPNNGASPRPPPAYCGGRLANYSGAGVDEGARVAGRREPRDDPSLSLDAPFGDPRGNERRPPRVRLYRHEGPCTTAAPGSAQRSKNWKESSFCAINFPVKTHKGVPMDVHYTHFEEVYKQACNAKLFIQRDGH